MTQRLSLLVVDDSAAEGKLLASVLYDGFADAEIMLARAGAEAIGLCQNQKIDCALIDFNMVEMNGLQLGERLRGEFPYLPMILMTAVGDEMLAAEALRNGFSDYIPKAKISRENIARLVRRAVQSIEQARVIDEQRTELEHFAYALAHDFKQPIRQIRTFTDLISEQVAVAEGSSAALHMEFLKAAAHRLGALVDVMSQYTLLNKRPELAVLDIAAVAQSARENISAFIAERNGAFLIETRGQVVGNEALLTQVLQNLVVNGLLYNTSSAPCVTLTAEDAEEGLRRLIVADNGIGIEERYQKDIFKPLMRLHAASQFPGAGLGLTITRKAVLAQGGEISCTSRIGFGSAFIIDLRRAPEADEVKTAA